MNNQEHIRERIKANTAKKAACPRHLLDLRRAPFARVVCGNCGGELDIGEALGYIAGYMAAGGDANDVAPNWEKPSCNTQ
jgi:hypothetical protein